MTVPLYCWRCCSSQSIDSASRWLVGSSSNNTSGFCKSKRQRATLRRSPPESVPMSCSSGGQRKASIARSILVSSSQASRASILSCTSPWRAMSLSILSGSDSTSSSIKALLISSYSARTSTISCAPSKTMSRTVLLGSSSGS